MHDRHDEQDLSPNLIDDPIRESIGPATASTFRKLKPGVRVLKYSFERPLYFRSKLITETFALGVVIGNSLGKLSFGRREKDDFHHSLLFPISANTSFAGIVAISPRSYHSI